MKRFVSCLLALILLLPAMDTAFSAAAASDGLRVISTNIIDPNPADDHYYFEFKFDEAMRQARYFQDPARRGEPGLMAAYTFPDELVDAVRKYVFINGASVGDHIEVNQNVDFFSFFYDSDDENGAMLIKIFCGYMPEYTLDHKITVEVKKGMIDADENPIVPFVAVYDPAVSRKDLKVTYAAATAATKRPTTTKKPAAATTTKKPGGAITTLSQNAPTGSTAATDISGVTDDPDTVTTVTDEVSVTTAPASGDDTEQAVMVSSTNSGITIDAEKKTITLNKSMSVRDFLAVMKSNSGYTLGVYNGPNPVAETEAVYTGYKLKIKSGDDLMASFLLTAPQPSNVGWILLFTAIGVVILAAAGVLINLFVIRKKAKQ